MSLTSATAFAKSYARSADEARKALAADMRGLARHLAAVADRLDAGKLPSSSGEIQITGHRIDMACAELCAMDDAAKKMAELLKEAGEAE